MGKYMAVDLGAESGRCVAGFLENGVMKMEELCRFPTQGFYLRGKMHWNVYRFYENILEGLKLFQERFHTAPDSVGVDTWGLDYGILDDSGELLSLPYTYRDQRTDGTDALLQEHREWLYGKTGIQFLECNTLNQLIASLDKDDLTMKVGSRFLLMADLLHYFLGAEPVCEYTGASITMLVNTREKCWDQQIFQKFHIPDKFQPPLAYAGDKIGCVRDDILKQVGINEQVAIIAPAIHDTASAVAATPAKEEEFAFISSGTWSLAGVELNEPVINDKSRAMNISNSGGVFGKTMFLKNVMGLWILQQCMKIWRKTRPDLSYQEVASLAEQAEPFYAYIDPDASIFFNPRDMIGAIRQYLQETGQRPLERDQVGQIARVIYESLAMQYRRTFEKITDVTGKKINRLYVTGGGSNNAFLNQLSASIMHMPVLAGPGECTALGNLLMQAYGNGDVAGLAEIRQTVRQSSKIVRFAPDGEKDWDKEYVRFRGIVE